MSSQILGIFQTMYQLMSSQIPCHTEPLEAADDWSQSWIMSSPWQANANRKPCYFRKPLPYWTTRGNLSLSLTSSLSQVAAVYWNRSWLMSSARQGNVKHKPCYLRQPLAYVTPNPLPYWTARNSLSLSLALSLSLSTVDDWSRSWLMWSQSPCRTGQLAAVFPWTRPRPCSLAAADDWSRYVKPKAS